MIFFWGYRYIEPHIKSRKEVRVGLTGRYKPENLPLFILAKLSRGLTRIDEKGIPYPDIASWVSLDDGKTWVFKIDGEYFWHDGKKLVAEHIKYEFSDVKVTYLSDSEIKFELEEKFSPFPSVLSKPIFKNGLLGIGDYRVKKLKLSSGYISELTLTDKDGNKEIYKFFPTEESVKVAFKLGKIDRIIDISDSSPFDKWSTVFIDKKVSDEQIVTLFFNTQDELLKDKSARQALAYSLDRNKFGQRALTPIRPNSWAYNPGVKEYNLDLKKARDLLENIPDNIVNSHEITLITIPSLLNQAELIAQSWTQLGIKVSVQVSSVIPTDYSAYLTILDVPADPDQYVLWHSSQIAFNLSKYTNPRIDKLLEDGRKETNLEERRKIYFDFQRFLLEDVPALFLYYPTYYDIYR